MSNTGIRPGLTADGWRYYEPTFALSSRPGQTTPTQPDLGNSVAVGRYLRFQSGMVIVSVAYKFGTTFAPGAGESYIVKMPFPANRWTTALSTSTADIPVGAGIATQGTDDNTTYSSTIGASSNTVNTNTFTGNGTLNVASTVGASANGTLSVATGGTTATVQYTAIGSATTFKGCNTLSGGGAMSTGGAVTGASTSPMSCVVIPTLADSFSPIAEQTQEDYWAHLFIGESKNIGTGVVAQGSTTATCYHGLGLTPVAQDILITPTGNPTTAPGMFSVQNITSTTFDVVTMNSLTSGTLPFSWKAFVEPNNNGVGIPQLVNYQRPWSWQAGHTLSVQFIYEARF